MKSLVQAGPSGRVPAPPEKRFLVSSNRTFHFSAALIGWALACAYAPAAEADRVLVVYNSNWTADNDSDGTQDSLQVADYYVSKRSVPATNMLGVTCSTGTRYYYSSGQHSNFYHEMVLPIRDKLTVLGPTNIHTILLCHGVPRQTISASDSSCSLDNALIGLNYITEGNNIARGTNPYYEETPTFSTDKGHFDHAAYKYYGTEMYLVCRLDAINAPLGPMDLVDKALYGERYIYPGDGYYNGNYVVDSRNGQGGSTRYTDAYLSTHSDVISGSYSSYDSADRNIAYGEHFALGSGFTLKWENTTSSLEIGEGGAEFSDGTSAETCPRALFYGGWYNFGVHHDVWEWLPGAVVCDLNSDSRNFGENAVQRGAGCYAGVIGEPYLTGHQRPNVLLYYIMQGYTFAEASILSTPTVGWMPINVGDPLYAPMKTKTPVVDTQYPQPAPGFPVVSDNDASGTRTITVVVDGSAEPEVVKIQVDYGFTTNYGLTVNSGQGYWHGRDIDLEGLLGNTNYHYRLTLTDPMSNVTVTGDFIFDTGAVPNTAPTAYPQTVVCEHDQPWPVTLTGSDPEGNALFYTVLAGPTNGILTGAGPDLTYNPTSSYSGPDSFTFKVDDGALDSGPATVTLNVMPTEAVDLVLRHELNGYPGARDTQIYSSSPDRNYGGLTSIATYHNGYRRILLGFDVSAIPSNSSVSSATLDLFCTAYSYPSAGKPIRLYRMTNSWVEGTSTGSDGTQDGCTWQEYDYMDHDVSPGGDWNTPGADYDEAVVHAERSTSDVVPHAWLRWSVRDLVQDWVSASVENQGMLIRTHDSSLSISYRSREYTTDVAKRPTLTVKYFPPTSGNQPPLAWSRMESFAQDTPGSIMVTAVDIEGAPLSYSIASQPAFGTLSGLSSNEMTYTPATGFNGRDSFTFRANDGTNDSNEAVVSITVGQGNAAPLGTSIAWIVARLGYTNDYTAAELEDPDKDRALTWEEYQAGTDPLDSNSVFAVIYCGTVNGSNMLSWYGTTNSGVVTPFGVQRSTGLLVDAWTLIASNLFRDASGTNAWSDPSPPEDVPVCYRPSIPVE